MKLFRVFAVIFFLAGISASAQDLIIFINGNVIEAKVTEITKTEIKYRRYDNLEGPVYIFPKSNFHSIKHENGIYQVFNTAPEEKKGGSQTMMYIDTAMDPDELTIGINANAGGSLLSGSSTCIEFCKGSFNAEINLIFPSLRLDAEGAGFGGLVTFNYFRHSRIGGLYIGGGLGYIYTTFDESDSHLFTAGLNLGYRFVTRSGMYFRTGGYIGAAVVNNDDENIFAPYIKPDLSVGYSF